VIPGVFSSLLIFFFGAQARDFISQPAQIIPARAVRYDFAPYGEQNASVSDASRMNNKYCK